MKKFMHSLAEFSTETTPEPNYLRINRPKAGTMSSSHPLEAVDQITDNRNKSNDLEEFTYMKSNRHYPVSKPRAITRWYDCAEADKNKDGDVLDLNYDRNLHDLTEDSFSITALNPLLIKKFQNLDAYPYVFETDYDVLCWATAIISESPMGLYLLDKAQEAGWKIGISDLGTGGFHLEIDEKIILLDHFGFEPAAIGRSAYYRLSLIPILAKALRDIVHEENFGAFEETYTPESTIQLERVRAADSDSISVFIGWELRSAGYDDIWRHMLSSDDGDMAQVMVNIFEKYPTAIYNGIAIAHIFRQWYADVNRIDAVDHDTLERLDNLLHQQSGLLGEETFSLKNIEALSLLPDGTAYLADLSDTVAKDPFFSAMNDSINQAHLFQIIYDNKVTYVKDIPFRDRLLAQKFLDA